MPIYEDIRDALSDDILAGVLHEGGPLPSTHTLAESFKVNPATAAKAASLLFDEGLLIKRRGLGLFIAGGARLRLLERRRAAFRTAYIEPMLAEAARLGLPPRDVVAMVAAQAR